MKVLGLLLAIACSLPVFAFCPASSFSSYTLGLFEVGAISIDENENTIELTIPLDGFGEPVVSLNGVCATLILKTPGHAVAKIEKGEFEKSSLSNLRMGERVSIGVPSTNSADWLLRSNVLGMVSLVKAEIAPGHQYTEQFQFECTEQQYAALRPFTYLGLDGSGLMIQQLKEENGRYYFWIHAGRTTREKTILSRGMVLEGQLLTLSSPVEPIKPVKDDFL